MTKPRLKRSESQWRDWDRDWKCLSLNDKTETENVLVSIRRPRLKMLESQGRDRDRDWKCLSLNDETETETEKVWVSMTRTRPRLKGSESQSRDRDHKNIETKTKVVETIKDETSKFGLRLISENLSRPRLIKTEKFYRCRDRDSSRLGYFTDAETETCRNWKFF